MEANMSEYILHCGGRLFQRFIHILGSGIHKPATKFATELPCGLVFTPDLVLPHVVARIVFFQGRPTAVAKRFRCLRCLGRLWSKYRHHLNFRLKALQKWAAAGPK